MAVDPRTPAGAPPVTRGRVALWVMAPVFFAGLLIGAVVVGLLAGRSASGPSAGPQVTATVTTTAPTTEHTLELVVNDACLDALRDANDLIAQVQQIRDAAGQSIKQFSTGPLDALLQRLDALQQQMRGSFSACHIDVHLPDGSVQATDLFGPTTTTTSG